jgi:hypothetical protein
VAVGIRPPEGPAVPVRPPGCEGGRQGRRMKEGGGSPLPPLPP